MKKNGGLRKAALPEADNQAACSAQGLQALARIIASVHLARLHKAADQRLSGNEREKRKGEKCENLPGN